MNPIMHSAAADSAPSHNTVKHIEYSDSDGDDDIDIHDMLASSAGVRHLHQQREYPDIRQALEGDLAKLRQAELSDLSASSDDECDTSRYIHNWSSAHRTQHRSARVAKHAAADDDDEEEDDDDDTPALSLSAVLQQARAETVAGRSGLMQPSPSSTLVSVGMPSAPLSAAAAASLTVAATAHPAISIVKAECDGDAGAVVDDDTFSRYVKSLHEPDMWAVENVQLLHQAQLEGAVSPDPCELPEPMHSTSELKQDDTPVAVVLSPPIPPAELTAAMEVEVASTAALAVVTEHAVVSGTDQSRGVAACAVGDTAMTQSATGVHDHDSNQSQLLLQQRAEALKAERLAFEQRTADRLLQLKEMVLMALHDKVCDALGNGSLISLITYLVLPH